MTQILTAEEARLMAKIPCLLIEVGKEIIRQARDGKHSVSMSLAYTTLKSLEEAWGTSISHLKRLGYSVDYEMVQREYEHNIVVLTISWEAKETKQ